MFRFGSAAQFTGERPPQFRVPIQHHDDRILPTIIPPRDIVTTLGDVMAHELGHLILPPGHSTVGIMRPAINMTSRRVETFTEAEATEMHTRLREAARTSNPQPRTPNGEPNPNTN